MIRFKPLFAVVLLAAVFVPAAVRAGDAVLTVFVVRHAQRGPRHLWPAEDREKHMIGELLDGAYSPPPDEQSITPLGEKQCAQLGRWLRERYHFDGRVFASPSFRTVQTAAAILAAISPDLEIIPEPRLRKITEREMPAEYAAELAKRFPGRIAPVGDAETCRISGEIPSGSAKERIDALVRGLVFGGKTGQVLIVGHSSTLPGLIRALNDLAAAPGVAIKPPARVVNCCLYVFEFDRDGRAVRIADDTANFLGKELITDNFRKKTKYAKGK